MRFANIRLGQHAASDTSGEMNVLSNRVITSGASSFAVRPAAPVIVPQLLAEWCVVHMDRTDFKE